MDIKRIEDRLDRMTEEIAEMNKTLAVNTKQLEIHIEGVKLAREQNNILKEDIDNRFNELLEQHIKPINKHIAFVQGAMWALGIVGASIFALQQMGILQKLIG
jgi:hypothetical protein